MITASGNINGPYRVVGLVTVSVIKPQSTGCNAGGLPVDAAYSEAVTKLVEEARKRDGNGVIHIGFEHRVSSSAAGCGSASTANFELYAWGTIIRHDMDEAA